MDRTYSNHMPNGVIILCWNWQSGQWLSHVKAYVKMTANVSCMAAGVSSLPFCCITPWFSHAFSPYFSSCLSSDWFGGSLCFSLEYGQLSSSHSLSQALQLSVFPTIYSTRAKYCITQLFSAHRSASVASSSFPSFTYSSRCSPL